MEDYSLKELKDRLNAIDRLSLVYTSRQDMMLDLDCTISKNRHLGSVGNNDKNRKIGLYNKLCNKVKCESGGIVDLDNLLTNYITTSSYFNDSRLRKSFPLDSDDAKLWQLCFGILDSQIKQENNEKCSNKNIRSILKDVERWSKRKRPLDVKILILMALGLLPSYGRVSKSVPSIPYSFISLFNFINSYFDRNHIPRKMPFYHMMEISCLKEQGSLPRYYLYFVMSIVISLIEPIFDPKKIYKADMEKRNRQIMPLGSEKPTYWHEGTDSDVNPSIIWELFPIKAFKSYLLSCFENVKKEDPVQVKAVQIDFMGSNNEGLAVVYNQSLVKTRLHNEIPDNHSVQILKYSINTIQDQCELFITAIEGYDWFKSHHFRKASDDIVSFFVGRVRESGIEKNEKVDVPYFNLQALKAITRTSLYIETKETSKKYYKIERNRYKGLELIKIDDHVELFEIKGDKLQKVIVVDPLGLVIDISSEELMRANGVKIVESIEP